MAHDFGNFGTVVSGAEASTNPAAGILPELPRAKFYLMHNPEGWEPVKREDGGWEWLPILKRLICKPGVNGVRGGRGGIDDSQARVGFQDRGWTIIDRSLGYITRYPCRKGYTYYLTWDKPVKAGRRVIVRHDAEGYNAFRRQLVEDGIVKAPVPEVLYGILNQYEKKIERNAKDIHIPAIKAKIDEAQEVLDGAGAMIHSDVKPKRARAKKADA